MEKILSEAFFESIQVVFVHARATSMLQWIKLHMNPKYIEIHFRVLKPTSDQGCLETKLGNRLLVG